MRFHPPKKVTIAELPGLELELYNNLERLLCPIFLGNFTPKTSNPVALKLGPLAFQEPLFSPLFFVVFLPEDPPQKFHRKFHHHIAPCCFSIFALFLPRRSRGMSWIFWNKFHLVTDILARISIHLVTDILGAGERAKKFGK